MIVRQPACQSILANLERVIYGKTEALSLVLVALLAEGHLLLEDVPGVGKTTLARTLARSLELEFKRIQFTPDLMPADIVGSSLLRPVDGTFSFSPGPVFTNVLLADEVNRASPRTQSALLEAMSERQVTTDGVTRLLPRPFFVLATQNPIEAQGTYPLPEAQLDRFFLRLRLGYPAAAQELSMLYSQSGQHPLDDLAPVTTGDALRALQAEVRAVRVERSVGEYVVRLTQATREHPDLALGASPRGTLALFHGAQSVAFLVGRDFVRPDDVQRLVEPVLSHRLELRAQARYAGRTPAQVLDEIVARVPVPT
jgi:MoxR-like ATPase